MTCQSSGAFDQNLKKIHLGGNNWIFLIKSRKITKALVLNGKNTLKTLCSIKWILSMHQNTYINIFYLLGKKLNTMEQILLLRHEEII